MVKGQAPKKTSSIATDSASIVPVREHELLLFQRPGIRQCSFTGSTAMMSESPFFGKVFAPFCLLFFVALQKAYTSDSTLCLDDFFIRFVVFLVLCSYFLLMFLSIFCPLLTNLIFMRLLILSITFTLFLKMFEPIAMNLFQYCLFVFHIICSIVRTACFKVFPIVLSRFCENSITMLQVAGFAIGTTSFTVFVGHMTPPIQAR